MFKILNGNAGMLRFRACRVANHTNQNIQRTQSHKYKQLSTANRACNVCRVYEHLLRALYVWMLKYILDKRLENFLHI